MHKTIGSGLAFTLALWAAPAAAEDYCRHKAQRSAALDVAGATRVEVVARAGSLRIEGRAGLARLSASGTACAPEAAQLDKVQILATRQGGTLRVEAQVPEGTWGLGNASLDLRIELPDSLALKVEDTSGPLEVRGVAALDLVDSSGEIVVEDVKGDLSVQDSSGEMRLLGVGGSVRVSDSSGEIEITRVGGGVEIEQDSSGGIRIAQVSGAVRVRADGSGEIDVRDVGGDFTVDRDGSGDITHRGVKGKVSLPAGK
jgi:hypothetical protein